MAEFKVLGFDMNPTYICTQSINRWIKEGDSLIVTAVTRGVNQAEWEASIQVDILKKNDPHNHHLVFEFNAVALCQFIAQGFFVPKDRYKSPRKHHPLTKIFQ